LNRVVRPPAAAGPLTAHRTCPTLPKHIDVIPGVVMTEEGFRAPEAKRIAGISYRQLDYWTRTGLVTPSVKDAHGSGTQRLYSFQDLATLRVIKGLLDTGISLQRVRTAVEHLRSMKRPPYGVTLMSDGHTVYEAHSPEAVVDLLRNGQGVFAISLDAVWNDLETDVSKASGRRRKAAAGGT
jgi:DNA-binding transcriptional MerR regulator